MKKFAAVLLLSLMVNGVALANNISIGKDIVNIRAEPTTKSELKWELVQGYPLQIIQKKGQWAQVKDFEGTLGWVYLPLTASTPHHIVKANVANLRSGPGNNHKVVGKLEKYAVVKTLEKQKGWVKISSKEGQTGWVSSPLLWGW